MPRIRTQGKTLRESVRYDDKSRSRHYQKPNVLYHGSPYKLKKGQKLQPKGPTFYGFNRPGLSASKSKGEAKQYSRASDTGGINKKRYGKDITPKTFATKGHLYEIPANSQKGWYKNYHGGHSEPLNWVSNKPQGFSKRTTVRNKGKLPITKGEAAGGAAVMLAAGGGYYYYRKHKGKQQRVKNANFNRRSSTFRRTHRRLR